MTTYNAIANSRVDPESPVNTSLITHLRDNPIAMAEGAAGAPRIARKAIQPGGSECDGALVNGTAAPTVPGFYEFDYITLTASKALAPVTIARIDGNVAINGCTLSVTPVNATYASIVDHLGCTVGNSGGPSNDSSRGAAGGGSLGNGGHGNANVGQPNQGGAGKGTTALFRRWLSMRMVGGLGGDNNGGGVRGGGGGVFVLYINGNLDMSGGGVLSANGESPGGDPAGGGGGGGTLIVICNGIITDGTFQANGGNGHSDASGTNTSGGGGGGGYVGVVAAGYVGTQTLQANGGAAGAVGGTSGMTAGTAGLTEKITLTEAQINALLLR